MGLKMFRGEIIWQSAQGGAQSPQRDCQIVELTDYGNESWDEVNG
jgi:hypothetical protein